MRYKVEFLGSGYEVVKFVFVEAQTMSEAFAKAETMYTGPYCGMEIPKEYAFNA